MSAPPNNKGLRRIVNAFFHSIQGMKACFKTEQAFQQEVCLAAIMIPASFFIGETKTEVLFLVASVFLVLIVEILNTAVERAIDRISFEKHELSKEAKDMGSAAVLLSLILAGIIWGMIGIPKLL